MKIGIPKEVMDNENRVGAVPGMVRALVEAGHEVWIQSDAGAASGFTNAMYAEAGAKIVPSAKEVYEAQMIVKVKEPKPSEYLLLKPKQILFCYLHLAADPILTQRLVDSNVIAIAYETVTDPEGHLPLLVPMSEMAGRIAIQAGANYLQMNNGGKGVLLGGVPGVLPARVVIIGGGVVGTEAARMALGLGAQVTVINKSLSRTRKLDELYGPRLMTLYSNTHNIEEAVASADLLVGAVLIPGKKAPKLVTRAMIKTMAPGSVAVDVAIDQGGCFETSKPTTHTSPTYVVEGVIHYCVTNMPGVCARTSTLALTNSTSEYALAIANKGYSAALIEDEHLRMGLNVCLGKVTHPSVALDLGYEYVPPEEVL